MQKDTNGHGNIVCRLDGHIKNIKGSLQNCPSGFSADHDQWGNPVCFDNQIMAYNLSNGCPNNLQKSWHSSGRETCLDFSGQPVVELID